MTNNEYLERLKTEIVKPQYAPQTINGELVTHCNLFVETVARWFGVELGTNGIDLANSIYQYLIQQVSGPRAKPIWTQWMWDNFANTYEDLVDRLANDPKGAVLCIAAQQAAQHGHVNIILAEPCAYSGNWKKNVPLCANVGKRNFYGEKLSMAFKTEPSLFLFLG